MEAPAGLWMRPAPVRLLQGTISRHQTLASVLQDSLSAAAVHELVETARPVYDLARLSVGHPFGLAVTPEGLLRAFSYGIDELRTLHVKRRATGLEAEVLTRTYETRTGAVSGMIASSLFDTIEEIG